MSLILPIRWEKPHADVTCHLSPDTNPAQHLLAT